jgi:LCP family protein required for cell wall assembly
MRTPSANQRGLVALGDLMDSTERTRPPGTSRRSKRSRWGRGRKLGVVGLVVMVAIVGVAGVAYEDVHYEWGKVRKAACRVCASVVAGKPFNILLIGSDTRTGNEGQAAQSFGSESAVGGQRSDTIKIIHIDPSEGTARLLSIPRDTYVTMSGLSESTGLAGAQKINTAFNNGPGPLIETIQNTFGIPINHWIVVDFSAVIGAVKALGGIRLDFRYPVRDDNDGTNESGLNVTGTGCQTLGGNAVLALSRSRYYEYEQDGTWQMDPGYDISRIQRQNTIIEAMISKATSTYDPLTLQSVINSLVSHITIDNALSFSTVYDLAEKYHAFSPSALVTRTLPTVPQMGTPAGDVELVNTSSANNYLTTIGQFLGTAPGVVATPPLNADGDPVDTTNAASTPTSSLLPGPPTTSPRRSSTTLSAEPATPSYEPTVC